MTTLNNYVLANGDAGLTRYAVLYEALVDEVVEELTDADEARIGLFMEYMGEVIAWIGHGDDSRLPEPVRGFAETIGPRELSTHT